MSPKAAKAEAQREADQVARDSANKAISLIEAHERVCTERQGHINANLQDIKRGVEGLYRRFWLAATGAISLLLIVCGVLVRIMLTGH